MHRPLSAAQAQQRVENRHKYAQLKKEREEIRNVLQKYLPQRPKAAPFPKRSALLAIEKPRQNTRKAPEPIIQVVIPESIAFESTCGGTIFWVIHRETVEIKDESGAVVHTLQISHGTVIVQTDAHMWLGTEDGTVHVFDKYSTAHILTHKGHMKAVRCFAKGIDDAVYSGSEDGTIAEWNDSVGDVRIILTQITLKNPIRFMVCYGFRLFVAQDDGSLTEYEAETSEVVRRFETNGESIVSLVCVNGYVCTVHTDGKALIWNMSDGKLRRTIQSTDSDNFTAAFADGWNQHLLLANVKNIISFFDMLDGGKFRCIRTIHDVGEGHIESLTGIPSVKHLEAMLQCNDGMNFVFDQQTDLVRQELGFALHYVQKQLKHIKLETREELILIEENAYKIQGIMNKHSIFLKEQTVSTQIQTILTDLCTYVERYKQTQKLLSTSENLRRTIRQEKIIWYMKELLRNSQNSRKIMHMKSKMISYAIEFQYTILSDKFDTWKRSIV